MKEKFTHLKDNPNYIFLCAVIDDKVVGTIMGIVCEELYGECSPFFVMEDLVVDKQYRRKGVAKALVTELIHYAKESGCKQIQFITEKNRKEALAFYKSLGFNANTHIGFKKSL